MDILFTHETNKKSPSTYYFIMYFIMAVINQQHARVYGTAYPLATGHKAEPSSSGPPLLGPCWLFVCFLPDFQLQGPDSELSPVVSWSLFIWVHTLLERTAKCSCVETAAIRSCEKHLPVPERARMKRWSRCKTLCETLLTLQSALFVG